MTPVIDNMAKGLPKARVKKTINKLQTSVTKNIAKLTTLLDNLQTREKIREGKVADLTILLKDLRNERVTEHKASVIIIQTQIENLNNQLAEFDKSVKGELVNYASPKELADQQDKINRYMGHVTQLNDVVLAYNNVMSNVGDVMDRDKIFTNYQSTLETLKDFLVKYESDIAELEETMKTLRARSNVFHNSVYLFLHKAPDEKYNNNVGGIENTVTWIHIAIAYSTILFQIGVYVFISVVSKMEHEAASWDPKVSINDTLAKDHEPLSLVPSSVPTATFPLTATSPPPPTFTPTSVLPVLRIFTYVGAFAILFGNLLPDLMGSLVLFSYKRSWAHLRSWAPFLIVCEVMFALGAALNVAVRQASTKSVLGLFLSMVGIIFIHSFDESIRLAMDILNLLPLQNKRSHSVGMILIFFVLLIFWVSLVVFPPDIYDKPIYFK